MYRGREEGKREEGKREEVEVTGKSEDVGTRRQVSCRNQRHLIGTHKKVIITAIKRVPVHFLDHPWSALRKRCPPLLSGKLWQSYILSSHLLPFLHHGILD